MLKIFHRINSNYRLSKIDKKYGVEIDVRSFKNDLIVDHEPFSKNISLSKYLKNFKHKFIIFNVKEEGIEKKIFNLIKKKNIKDYFFLDVNMPTILKHLKKKEYPNLCLRISKYEKIQNLNYFENKIRWIWVDSFDNKIPLNVKQIQSLSKKFKLCLVSPELIDNKNNNISKFVAFNKKKLDYFTAVCTKQVLTWNDHGF